MRTFKAAPAPLYLFLYKNRKSNDADQSSHWSTGPILSARKRLKLLATSDFTDTNFMVCLEMNLPSLNIATQIRVKYYSTSPSFLNS